MSKQESSRGAWTAFVALSLLLAFASSAHGAGVFLVDAASTAATPDGQSWATAYPTLQAATDAASAAGGGELWVRAGTYTAATDPVLTMKDGVNLYGGFAGDETARDQRNWAANTAVISGENLRCCVNGAANATLDGFTVAFGKSMNGGGMYGGTAVNCTFTGNTASDSFSASRPLGGGMYGGTATNCTFTGNTAISTYISRGGAMGNGTATNCTFTGNTAISSSSDGVSHSEGGAMSGGTATNCTFTGNAAISTYTGSNGKLLNHSYGGGMSYGTATNCTFTGNTAISPYSSSGGGMLGGTAVNCTFTGNTARSTNISGGSYGGGIRASMATNCTFTGNTVSGIESVGGGAYDGTVVNCIYWGNLASTGPELDSMTSVTYSCIQGGHAGEGNIADYPQFAGAPGNLRLLPGSPCVDTGTATGAPATDLLGKPRPQGAGVDMGAYENAVLGPYAPVVGAAAPATNPPTWTWTSGGGGIGQFRFGFAEGMWEASDVAALFYTPPVPLAAGDHTLYVQERDTAGTWSASGTHTLTAADSAPPTGTIVINNNASTTTSAAVALTLTWNDGINGSGVTRMRFSNDGQTWSPWEQQVSMKPWTLPAGAGYKTVRVQFMDRSGNRSAVYSDYIKVVAP